MAVEVHPPRMARWKRPFRDLRRQFRGTPKASDEAPSRVSQRWKDLSTDGAVGVVLSVVPGLAHFLAGRFKEIWILWLVWLGSLAAAVFLYGSDWAMPFLGLTLAIHAWIAVSYKMWQELQEVAEKAVVLVLILVALMVVYRIPLWVTGLSVSPSTLTVPHYGVQEGDALMMRRVGGQTASLARGSLVRVQAPIYRNGMLWTRQETFGQVVGLPGETVFLRGDAFLVAGRALPAERFPVPSWMLGVQATIPLAGTEYLIAAEYIRQGHGGQVDSGVIREMSVVPRSDVEAVAFMRWWPWSRRGRIEVD